MLHPPHAIPEPAHARRRSSTRLVSVDPGNTNGRGPMQAQGRDHADCPPGGRAEYYPLPPRHPGVGQGDRRGDPRLVHENQLFRLDLAHLPPERRASSARRAGRAGWRAGSSSLRVRPRRSRANQRVFRLHWKPPRCLSCSSVASGCSRTNPASRSRSPGSRAGGGPPRCGSGASVPAVRRRWSRRTIKEVLTRKIRAIQRIEPS